MTKHFAFAIGIAAASAANVTSVQGAVIVNLSPDTAVVNATDTNGKTVSSVTPAADNSILPSTTIGTDDARLKGMTMNVTFTPAAGDLTGTVLLMEIGGTSSGTGIYLVNGVPTLVGKQNSTSVTFPTSLNDTDLSDDTMAVQADGGALTAGTTYSVATVLAFTGDAGADDSLHAAKATLAVDTGGGGNHVISKEYLLTDKTTNGINWSGNQTVSIRTRTTAPGVDEKAFSGYLGGLAEDGTDGGVFFTGKIDGTGGCKSFEGTISEGLLWNATGTVLKPTIPTTLPSDRGARPAPSQPSSSSEEPLLWRGFGLFMTEPALGFPSALSTSHLQFECCNPSLSRLRRAATPVPRMEERSDAPTIHTSPVARDAS